MHQTQIYLGQIAAVCAILQVVPYVRSILQGRTRPSRASYAIWSVIQVIGLISYISAGATTTVWTMTVLTFNAVFIFVLSVRYGVKGSSKVDIPCLIIATLA